MYANQEMVFNALGEFLLGNALRGYNCSLFAYGQTGSGKTYTMLGMEGGNLEASGGEEIGIVPRLCQSLFDRVKAGMQAGLAKKNSGGGGGGEGEDERPRRGGVG